MRLHSVPVFSMTLCSRGTHWSGGRWTDLNDVPFNNSSPSWLTDGPILEFGGRERLYSQLLRSTCSANSIDGASSIDTKSCFVCERQQNTHQQKTHRQCHTNGSQSAIIIRWTVFQAPVGAMVRHCVPKNVFELYCINCAYK